MSKQQPIRVGDRFKDDSGSTLRVISAGFGDERIVVIENDPTDASFNNATMHLRCNQLRQMARI